MKLVALFGLVLALASCDDGCDLCPIAVKSDAAANVSGCGQPVQPDAGVEALTVTENIFD